MSDDDQKEPVIPIKTVPTKKGQAQGGVTKTAPFLVAETTAPPSPPPVKKDEKD